MKLARIVVTVCLLAPLLAVASSASAATPCEPRTASTYRYDSTVMRSVFLLRVCEDIEETTMEIQFDRLDLVTGMGTTVFALIIAECRNRICATQFGYNHGNELARYDIHAFWFGLADDHIGPLSCVTAGERSGCRSGA